MIAMTLKILLFLSVTLGLVTSTLIFTSFGNQTLTSFLPVGEISETNFETLELSSSPNQYLICPKNYCVAPINEEAPQFSISALELAQRWKKIIAHQPRISHVKVSKDGQQMDIVQRTEFIRYPDIITVRFISIDAAASTLAIYSRSVYGKSDFGVNKTRIDAWFSELARSPQ
ncbi:MAG: DUF1499 domain-containing protein [Sneathiella sp.]|nr:DUF1499 domain-containing protein [Sneathiella sp.]